MRIKLKAEATGIITLALMGPLSGSSLGELRREIERARRLNKRITIDLGEVTLLDRYSLSFLAVLPREEVALQNCPEYIQPWLEKETARSGAACG